MAQQFQMPKLGLTMEEGTILQWLVEDETEVAAGQAVLIIETDKVETEVEASGSGILKQFGEVDETYPCGTLIGWFLEHGETPPEPQNPASGGSQHSSSTDSQRAQTTKPEKSPVLNDQTGRILASPSAKRLARELGIDLATISGSGPRGRIVNSDVELAAANPPTTAHASTKYGSQLLASFAARNLADLIGIELDAIEPAGPDRRITRLDVIQHIQGLIAPAPQEPPTPELAALSQTPSEVIPMTGMRGTIARRMHKSLQEMAQLTITMEVEMTRVVEDREKRKSESEPPGYTDYVIAATAAALQEHPYVNSQMTEEGLAVLPVAHVGMAVALEQGLIVPVIRNTYSLDLGALAEETKRLAAAAREGRLTLDELEGGTFAVTALGMYDVDGFTPVINPPNTAILGVGRLRETAVWENGSAVGVTTLTLSFSWDHRAFDGAPAALFLQTVKQQLEGWGSETT